MQAEAAESGGERGGNEQLCAGTRGLSEGCVRAA